MHSPEIFLQVQPSRHRSRCWASLCLAGILIALPARAQVLDFTQHCMRLGVEGLVLHTSPACISAFRTDPSARTQFLQLIQVTLDQAESVQRDASMRTTPAQALRRLFDKASLEPGRVVGVGGAYYGAQ